MPTLRDDLIAAKALIDTPEKWTKGIDRGGFRLCAMYAVLDVTGPTDRYSAASSSLKKALPLRSSPMRGFVHPVAEFNDDITTDHADIMALFDRAIAAASKASPTQGDD